MSMSTTYGSLIKELIKEVMGHEVEDDLYRDANACVPGVAECEIPGEELEGERKRLKRLILQVISEGPEKNNQAIQQWAAKN
jgi:hypothetical protein